MKIKETIRALPAVKYYLEHIPALEYQMLYELTDTSALQREYLNIALSNGLPLKTVADVMEIPWHLRNVPHEEGISLSFINQTLSPFSHSDIAQLIVKERGNFFRLVTLLDNRFLSDDRRRWIAFNLQEYEKLAREFAYIDFHSLDLGTLLLKANTPVSAIRTRFEAAEKARLEKEEAKRVAEERRKAEWKDVEGFLYSGTPYNIYSPHFNKRIVIEGLEFIFLDTKAEFEYAGARFNNCIGRYGYYEKAKQEKKHLVVEYYSRRVIFLNSTMTRVLEHEGGISGRLIEEIRKAVLEQAKAYKARKEQEKMVETIRKDKGVITSREELYEKLAEDINRSVRRLERGSIRFDPFSWTGRR